MAKTATYSLIANQTLGAAAANIIFSSIPATFTDLILVASCNPVLSGTSSYYRFNSDATSSYAYNYISGNGTAASSGRNGSYTAIYAGAVNSNNSVMTIHFQDYANTTTYKTAISRASAASNAVESFFGLYKSTSAISSITYYPDSGNWNTGSTFKLYGILAGSN